MIFHGDITRCIRNNTETYYANTRVYWLSVVINRREGRQRSRRRVGEDDGVVGGDRTRVPELNFAQGAGLEENREGSRDAFPRTEWNGKVRK